MTIETTDIPSGFRRRGVGTPYAKGPARWWLLLAALFVLGIAFRLFWFRDFGFPINDGALFAAIADAIMANGMLLPTEYDFNGHTLPLSYPPLGLWIAALISKLTGADMVLVATWYPFATNILIMVGSLGFLRAMKAPWPIIVLAAAFLLFQHHSMRFLMMGGGITRGTSVAVLVVAFWATVRLVAAPGNGRIAGVALLCGTAILSHLEFGMAAAIGITLLILMSDLPIGQRVRILLMVGAGSFAVIVPWLYWVLVNHGLGPFLAASETSAWCLECSALAALQLDFLPWYVAIPGFIGILELARQRKHFWLLFALAIIFIIPRNAGNLLILPNSVLAAYGTLQLARLFTLGREAWDEYADRDLPRILTTPFSSVLILVVCVAGTTSIGSIYSNSERDVMETLTPEARAGMAWVNEHIPAETNFVVYSGDHWASDETAEWFPYLTQSHSLSTAQGLEWVGNGYFNERLGELTALRSTALCSGLVMNLLDTYPGAEYVFAVEQHTCFDDYPAFTEVYSNDGAAVFKITGG
ncbi:MAG: hypothetical protein AAF871_05490 [Pseudomonadota bacterium]